MNEDRMAGGAEQLAGKTKGLAGDVTGNDRLRTEGKLDDLQGQAREALGQAKEMARDAAGAVSHATEGARRWVAERAPERVGGDEVRDALSQAGRQVLHFVRERPLAALGIAAAFAFVLGRANRDNAGHRRGIWS